MPNLIPALIALFLLAALLRIDTYFSLVYLLAAAYVFGRLWSRQSMRQLKTQRRLIARAFPGDTIPVALEVRNEGWLPVPWVEMHDSLPVDMASPPFYRRVITLLPYESQRFEYTLSCSKRGYHVIGPMIWRTGDLLGFAPQQAGQQQPEYIIVYPRVLPLEKLGLPTRSPLASLPAPAPLFEDPTRIVGVRSYQIGDSPRRIHWTASAHADALLVKRYQPAIARETHIFLDLDQDNYALQRFHIASELAVVTAASLAHHIVVREDLAVGLATQATDPLQEGEIVTLSLPPQRGRAHLMSVLEILARAEIYQQSPERRDGPLSLPDFLRRESVKLSWGATIVLISGRETDALYDSLVYLRRQGFAVALILVMPTPPDGDMQARAASMGLPTYRVWREEELELL
ncbi:MAG: DUF58 domain-containing protein [Anaerolineae bacterium]